MQSQQKVRTGDLEISGQGNRSTAKHYSIIQLRPTSTMTMASDRAKIGRETKNFSMASLFFGDDLHTVVQFLLPGDHDPFAPVESLVDAPHSAVGVARGGYADDGGWGVH